MARASANPRLIAGVNADPAILLHWNFRARRRWCEDVKNERNKASGAEIKRSGLATGSILLWISFAIVWLFLPSLFIAEEV
jgi:hypothetical protein